MYFCVVILISCCLGTGFGTITKVPRNVVALVGNTAMLECCTDVSDHSILWRRLSLNTEDSSDIYLGESLGFVDDFGDGRFRISNGNTSGCYNLIISDIRPDDTGTYTCADEYNVEHSADANVTILESFTCHEDYPNKDVYMGINEFDLDPDMIQFTCSFKYRGRFIPEMQWKWQKSSKISNFKAHVTNVNTSSTSIATIVAAKEFDRNKIMCFVQSPRDEDLSRNTVNWTSKLYGVKYAIFRNKEVVNCTAEELKLECNPNCSVSSVIDSNGSYFCEISYSNDRKRYVGLILEGGNSPVIGSVIRLAVEIKSEIPCWTTAKVQVIIAAVSAVIGFMGFIFGLGTGRLICWKPNRI